MVAKWAMNDANACAPGTQRDYRLSMIFSENRSPLFGIMLYDARLISIVSWMKPRSASLSKGLRKIFKSGGAACAASL
jgi:hypothetical protein